MFGLALRTDLNTSTNVPKLLPPPLSLYLWFIRYSIAYNTGTIGSNAYGALGPQTLTSLEARTHAAIDAINATTPSYLERREPAAK